ncbi:DUF1642 domain-containing protein [Lactococcus garvieae]|uniref:DUF1642 domain-containing protein n=1 Tax=Lactococcus garvieae TaxID=1363 RepID=UPI00189C5765|nr:DUF1642 domain-containing protein [Lactococcus garvieae]MDB7634361.1 DUF1642 domain-containing protein [Lactococcus garvieae]
MKKFEEELFSEVPCKFGLSTEGEYKQSILVKHFGDWVSPEDHQFKVGEVQDDLSCANEEIERLNAKLEKQQPEIPEFVAEYIEAAKEDCWTLFNALDDSLSLKVGDWLRGGNFSNQEILAQAWLHGYTVAKEKRFYLKNKLTGAYLRSVDGCMTETFISQLKTLFTQQEIDSMETGSYEKIEVEE